MTSQNISEILRDYQITVLIPLDETHLVVVRGLIKKEVSPKCVNKESSTERRSYNRQVNRSPQLQCQVLSQYLLDKIRKAFSS